MGTFPGFRAWNCSGLGLSAWQRLGFRVGLGLRVWECLGFVGNQDLRLGGCSSLRVFAGGVQGSGFRSVFGVGFGVYVESRA